MTTERTEAQVRRGRRIAVGAALAAALACVLPAGAGAATQTLTFTPEADTYVAADEPATNHGRSASLWVDADPQRQSLLRFWPLGLAGRQVTGARLRMTQRDASQAGGRIYSMSQAGWPDTVTWDARPLLDGPLAGTYGAVRLDGTYAAPLSAGTVREGVLSLGLDSTTSDGSRWASSETGSPPRLEVDVETPAGFVADGLSVAAGARAGSSEPTYFGSNRRVAQTAAGRTLAVHGRHHSGVQLAWRDPSGVWENRTRGAVAGGGLLTGTETGDWPASIAVTRDAAGAEVAWVVWSGVTATARRAVQMRRLTGLDDPAGPRVGPVVTVDAAPGGAYRADLAFERTAAGVIRGCVLWTRRTADGSAYEVVAGWFGPGSETPSIVGETVLHRTSSDTRFGTLAPVPGGLRAAVRADGGALTLYGHRGGDALTSWTKRATGPYVSTRSAPSAVALASGDVLVAVEHDVDAATSSVLRFPAAGGAPVRELLLTGYRQPTIASNGTRATVAAVRDSTGHVVSRTRSGSGAWTTADRLEIGAEGRSRLKHPNALREVSGRLRLLVEGPDATRVTSAVLGYQRPFY